MLDAVYSEHPSALPGAVVWTLTLDPSAQQNRILPDGCMDLIWSDGRLLVAGPDTSAQVVERTDGSSVTGLRFAPGFAPSVLGVPGHVLRDLRVDLDALWAAHEVARLTDLVEAAPDRGAALERVALERLAGVTATASWTGGAVQQLLSGASVTAVAQSIGYSERQLHRRSLDAFGYGLNALARVLRMTRGLDLARAGGPLASVAVAAGYADQPHFARDVKSLAGVSVTELLGDQAEVTGS